MKHKKNLEIFMHSSRSITRLLHSPWFLLVNLACLLFVAMTFGKQYVSNREVRTEIDRLQAQAESLVVEQVNLKELETALQTQSAIEREARLKLGLMKPGESVVVIQDATTAQEEEPLMTPSPTDPLGLIITNEPSLTLANPTKWWYYFFNHSMYRDL